ncbi:MAG: cardiolipin synthase [Clostridiales bacterium]|nr:cardiolipin synthase [Clostridiales bacterium]
MKKLNERQKKWIERTVSNNRSYKLYLYNRFFLFLVLVLAQIVGYVWLAYLFAYNSRIGLAVQLAVGILEIIVLFYLINKNDRPSVKLNWILLILLVPIVGVPMYLLYGEGRPTRLMNRKILRAKEENNARWEEIYGQTEIPEAQTREEAIGRYLAQSAEYPLYRDGEIVYYKSGEEMFPAMKEALKSAEKYILIEYFIIAHGKMWQEMLSILLEKAAQGVQVRIIYDDFGCMMTLPPNYEKYLESLHENIRCMTFNDVVPIFAVRMNNRDHRKILVVDGKTAFTGGINLADEYIGEIRRFGYWKDSGVKITGNAVRSFVKMFFYIWNAFYKTKEDIGEYLPVETENDGGRYALNDKKICIQPYDDSPFDRVSVGETVYLDIINRASRYVYIFTPYLVLDDSLRSALCLAALRGVDVRIVTPAIPDKKTIFRLTRANYGILLKAGVKIYEYTPGFIHAKSMVSDDECAVVGTINFDYRSLYLHFENAVYFSGCEAVMAVKKDCEETFAVSKKCTPENTKRNLFGRLIDSLLRVFETLF